LAEFKTAKEALVFRDHVTRSPLSPMCLELVSPGARKLMRPQMTADAWVIAVRAAGSDSVLARYRRELGSTVTREVESEAESKIWRAIENFGCADSGGNSETSPDLLYLSTWPRDVGEVVDATLEAGARSRVEVSLVGRVGVGLLLLRVSERERCAAEGTRELIDALCNRFGERMGVKVRGAVNPWPIAPANLAEMRAVKHALDSNHVLCGRDID
jgi:hypothetical protein